MPTHRVSRASLHEDLMDIERRQGERVLSVVVDPEDNSRYIIETELRTAPETRATVYDPFADVWTSTGRSA